MMLLEMKKASNKKSQDTLDDATQRNLNENLEIQEKKDSITINETSNQSKDNYKMTLGKYVKIASGDNFYYCFDTSSTISDLMNDDENLVCFLHNGDSFGNYALDIDAPDGMEYQDSHWGQITNPKYVNSIFEVYFVIEETPVLAGDDVILHKSNVLKKLTLLQPGEN